MKNFILLIFLILISFTAFGKGSVDHEIKAINKISLESGSGVQSNNDFTLLDGKSIILQDDAGGENVSIKAPSSVPSNYVLVLPVDDGTADQVLKTDGAGILSWVNQVLGFNFIASNDNRLLRTDTVGADQIQESGIVVDDTDAISNVVGISLIGSSLINFTEIATPSTPAANLARLYFDLTEKKLASKDDNGDVIIYGEGGGAGDVENILTDGGFEQGVDEWTSTVGSITQDAVLFKNGENSLDVTSGSTIDIEACKTNTAWEGREVEVGCFIDSALDDIQLCINNGTTDEGCRSDYAENTPFQYIYKRRTLQSGEDMCLHITSASAGTINLDNCHIGEPKLINDTKTKRQYYFADLTTAFDVASVLDSEGSGLFTVVDNLVGNTISITALTNIYLTLGGEIRSTVRAFLAVYDGLDFKVGTLDMNGTTNPSVAYSPRIFLRAGDIARVEGSAPGGVISEARVSITAVAASSNILAETNNEPMVKCTSTAFSVPHNSPTVINFSSCEKDANLRFTTGASSRYTVVNPGDYKICANGIFATTTWTAGDNSYIRSRLNGSNKGYIDFDRVEVGASKAQVMGGGCLTYPNLKKDDYLDLTAYQDSGASGADNFDGNVTVERIDVNALLSGLEERNKGFKAENNGITTLITTNTPTKVILDTDDGSVEDSFDRENNYDTITGLFTADETARYLFIASCSLSSALTEDYTISIQNDTQSKIIASEQGLTSGGRMISTIGITELNKGDEVSMIMDSSTDASYRCGQAGTHFQGYRLSSISSGEDVLIREETLTSIVSGNFTGGNIELYRQGRQVTLYMETSITHASGNTIDSAAGLLPEWARPSNSMNMIYTNDVTYTYKVVVFADGSVRFVYRDWAGSASNRVNAGGRFSYTYLVD